MSARSVPTPHTVQVWSIVYFRRGHAKCLLLDKRTSPHFLYFYNHRIGDATVRKLLLIMKRFIPCILALFAGCLLTTSCEKDDFDSQAKHSYTVTANLVLSSVNNVELRFYEYNDNNEMINYHIWKNVQNNETRTFDAHDLATKFVVYISADTSYGGYDGYVSQIFYLLADSLQKRFRSVTRVFRDLRARM